MSKPKPNPTRPRTATVRPKAPHPRAQADLAAIGARLLDEAVQTRALLDEIRGRLPAILPNLTAGREPALLPGPRALPAALSFADGLAGIVAGDGALTERAARLERDVRVTVLPRTRSGKALHASRGRPADRPALEDYRPDTASCDNAVRFLESNGLSVLRRGRFGITAKGTADQVRKVLNVELRLFALPRREPSRSVRAFARSAAPPTPDDLFVAPVESINVRVQKEGIDDLMFIPPPLYFGAPAPAAPRPAYHHLQEADIRRLLNVPAGATGAGVRVAVIDTGFFPHPYYAAKGYKLTPVPTAVSPHPERDENGHGTAVTANVFAVAPGCEVLGIQKTDVLDALEEAANRADVISCSWGWPYEQSFPVIEKTLQDVVAEGKIVLFASGNGQQAWPATMPEVLAIGGVYADAQGVLEASNYASGFVSSLYPPRRVPDVSGLCGQTPRGIYIVMPCPPHSPMDVSYSGVPFPDADSTQPDDGWLAASGTSSATPQIAGVVALLLERARAKGVTLDSASVRTLLEQTAKPVESGSNAFGFPASGQPNVATGYGLVDAAAALGRI